MSAFMSATTYFPSISRAARMPSQVWHRFYGLGVPPCALKNDSAVWTNCGAASKKIDP